MQPKHTRQSKRVTIHRRLSLSVLHATKTHTSVKLVTIHRRLSLSVLHATKTHTSVKTCYHTSMTVSLGPACNQNTHVSQTCYHTSTTVSLCPACNKAHTSVKLVTIHRRLSLSFLHETKIHTSVKLVTIHRRLSLSVLHATKHTRQSNLLPYIDDCLSRSCMQPKHTRQT